MAGPERRVRQGHAVTDEPSTLPAPGWYPDPSGPGGLRYWDGARWTGSTSLPTGGRPPGAPHPAGLWVTAMLSAFVFWFHASSDTSQTTIAGN
jgi:hypothetical protein